MKTVVFTAQAFGFGPVSKMIAVSEHFQNVRKVFFGTDVAYDLAKIHPFDGVYDWTLENHRSEILSLMKRADLFVNVMDFPVCRVAKEAGCQQFLFDSLLWFWPEIPEEIHLVDTYFCQEFFGKTAAKIEEYKLKNAKLISPIVSQNFEKREKFNQVMVNFGGCDNPFITVGKNSSYPMVMLEILLPLLENRYEKILVTGRERVLQMLRAQFQHPKLSFKMLSQKEMLEELYRSQVLFTAPGIQTFYDAHDKLPIFCLPPQNSSNRRNLKILIENSAIQHCCEWEDLYEWDDSSSCEEQEIQLILKNIQRLSADTFQKSVLSSQAELFITRYKPLSSEPYHYLPPKKMLQSSSINMP